MYFHKTNLNRNKYSRPCNKRMGGYFVLQKYNLYETCLVAKTLSRFNHQVFLDVFYHVIRGSAIFRNAYNAHLFVATL